MTKQERQAFIRATPEEWEKIVAEAERDEELGSDPPDFMDLSM